MTSPAVSVVIPTHQRAGAIRASVQSVLRQTFEDFELIVVDDGSSDGTEAALAAIPDPRLKTLRHERNRGANAARNTGLAAAAAPLVAYQDSDDEWLPDKLARQLARLEAAPAETVAVYCGLALAEPDPADGRMRLDYLPRADGRAVEGDLTEALLVGNIVSTQTLLARRSALRQAGGFDEALPALQDWDMALRLARRGPFAFVDEPLAIQRLSPNSLTRAKGKRLEAYARVLEKNLDLLEARPALLAFHRRAIALGHARLGARGEALAWAARGLRGAPDLRWGARMLRALASPSREGAAA